VFSIYAKPEKTVTFGDCENRVTFKTGNGLSDVDCGDRLGSVFLFPQLYNPAKQCEICLDSVSTGEHLKSVLFV
jgi:hypothetical protein